MKTHYLFVSILLSVTLLSCLNDDDTENFETVPTTIQGRVFDLERNIPIANFEIRLIKNETCPNLAPGPDPCPKHIATVFSDQEGYYTIDFDFVLDGDTYSLEKFYDPDNSLEYRFLPEEYPEIVSGVTNSIDIDAWEPVYLQLNLSVRNNFDPSLRVGNRIYDYTEFPMSFAQAYIFEENIDTTVYLKSKPNALAELYFKYNTGTSNADFHTLTDMVQTTLQDTISFDYVIDCTTF